MEVHPSVISAADLQDDGMDTQVEEDGGRPSFPAISAVDAQVSSFKWHMSRRPHLLSHVHLKASLAFRFLPFVLFFQ